MCGGFLELFLQKTSAQVALKLKITIVLIIAGGWLAVLIILTVCMATAALFLFLSYLSVICVVLERKSNVLVIYFLFFI